MLMRLARQTYVRQYGEFTYLFGKVTAFDQVFRSAGPFFAHLTRSPRERDEIVDEIVRDYADAPRDVVVRDFDELFAPLIAERVVLAGGSAAELDAMEPAFTYDCDDPKTAKDTRRHTYEEIAALPATMLEKYFAVHPTLFELQMDVTQACTERCRHCYVPEYNPLFLPYGKICEVLDEFRGMGGIHVSLSGGECMLHPDFIRIVRAIRERDCTVSCLSNLTVCTDEIVAALVEADAAVASSAQGGPLARPVGGGRARLAGHVPRGRGRGKPSGGTGGGGGGVPRRPRLQRGWGGGSFRSVLY